mmetsp:Transcript_10824/g.10944  ORF Transcript_10824/g.10944 Transcript_10824/m.10944 type:complete len:229 (+) Transcript_10824:447-1133(+)
MEAPPSFITDGLAAAPHQHSHCLRVRAVLDEDHLVVRGPERHLLDGTCLPQLLWSNLLETRNDPSPSGDGDQLYLQATNPTHRGQLVVHQQVVRLIIKAPLTQNYVGSRIFDHLDHVSEVFLLKLIQLIVVFHRFDLQTMLSFWLGGLEGAGEDADFGIIDLFDHLGVGEVLINYDSVDEGRVLQGPASLGNYLNMLKVNILPFQICHSEDSLHSDVCELLLALADHL